MSSCSASSPVVCHPNYVKYNRPEVVTVVYAEPLCTDRQALTLEVVESNSGTIVSREAGRWNGDRVFTFTCPPLTTFGYHEVTPIVRKEGRERKLPTFSICCSTCWQLYDQLHQLACSDSLLHVCLVALQLCQSPEQAQDPYWDVMCQMALDACVKQPHTLSSQGFPSARATDLPVRDLFGNMFGEQTLQQFLGKHKLLKASQTLSAMSGSTQTHTHVYDETCVYEYSNPIPGPTPNPIHGPASNPIPGPTPNPICVPLSNPVPGPASTPPNYGRMVPSSPLYPQPQTGHAHPQTQTRPSSPYPQRSKKPPMVSPKPGPAQKPQLKPPSEEGYTPFAFGTNKEDEELSDGEEYLMMEVQPPDRRANYSASTLTSGRTPQSSGALQHGRSAHARSCCELAPATLPRANNVMATQGSHSKVPLLPPSAMTLPSMGNKWKGNARK